MAIFRGTTGTGSSDNTIVSAVTEQAGIATTKADEAEGFRDEAEGFKNTASTAATTATTKASNASDSADTASDKATEANTAKGLAEDAQTAAENARDAALGHANTANSSAVQTVAGSNTQVVGVYNNIANVNTVAGVNTDVTTVAGISSDVTTVAADASDIGTVSTNITNVNNVGNNIANVNAVHGNASNINTVAADGTDIGTVASNISNVNTVAGISSDVTTVAGLESKMDTVIADASDIGAVAGNIGDVTTVAGINSDVDTVAGIAAKVTTVADNITDVQNADTNAANASASASQAANSETAASASATTASTKATEASNSATAASNSATTATTKATEAAGSATTATTKATEASTSATNAATSATTATTKAGEAASSASAASGSATTATNKAAEADASAVSAASSATKSSNAASTWNNFYNSYLGVADAPPSVDVLGNAIVAGALYYDTGAGSNTVGLYVYNGSSWVYSTNYNNVTAPYSLSQDLATNSHDISFGDNAKANFGASDDLQIYHDGSNSYVTDTGTGGLYLRGSNEIALRSSSNENIFLGLTDGSAYVYHNGSVKLQTTATGIDVTGTATMDGLDVRNTSSPARIKVQRDDNTNSVGSASIDLLEGTGINADFGVLGSFGYRLEVDGSTNKFNIKSGNGASVANRLSVDRDTGDISFYEDTGTTPKFFWDASAERLGIGTTTPSGALQIYKAGLTSYQAYTNTGTGLILQSYQSQGNPYTKTSDIVAGSDGTVPSEIRLLTRTAGQSSVDERMRIDSSGNVGIGTTSPSALLHVKNNDAGFEVDVDNQVGNGVRLLAYDRNTSTDRNMQYRANQHLFNIGASEKMRIDSSGNVLVGKTANSIDTVGGLIRANGQIGGCVDGDYAGVFNRKTSDGNIVLFRKDSATVGSIAVDNSDNLVIEGNSTHSGLSFGTNEVLPYKNGAYVDNTLNIGSTLHRFKDLYLSGGVYLGGTGTANKLDDYEEGTWTPILYGSSSGISSPLSFGAFDSAYTKVGRLVHFTAYITNVVASGHSLTGEFRIAGLPFASSKHSPIDSITYGDLFSFDDLDTTVGGYVSSGSTFISVRKGSTKTAVSTSELENSNVKDLMISGTYVV